jgi:leucyl-tRNA synthetase
MTAAYDSKTGARWSTPARFDGTPVTKVAVPSPPVDWLEANGLGKQAGQLPPARLADQPPAHVGRADPDGLLPNCGAVPVPYEDLPVLLPDDAEFKPTGESPLKYHEGFRYVKCPNAAATPSARPTRMDTFMCSSWYQYAYLTPYWKAGEPLHADDMPWDPDAGQLLAAGRPVHRRHRTRHHAPAVHALLHQGAARPGHGGL